MALYAAHHVGDYWVQTDHQAAHKGAAGKEGSWACTKHVVTYTATQAAFLALECAVTGRRPGLGRAALALGVSALTHYAADRRDHGLMVKLAKRIPGKAKFLRLGVPRAGARDVMLRYPDMYGEGERAEHRRVAFDDNPSLGTGSWALDQSWHIALGVFLPALILEGKER